jgi:tetratricopeptide (TPR) repeat protein
MRRRVVLAVIALSWASLLMAHPTLDRQLADAEAAITIPVTPADGARSWHRLAEVHRQRGEWDAAEAAYVRAGALDPALHRVDLDLGRMRLGAGRIEAALLPLTRYAERRPDDPEGWSATGRALAALGRHAAAAVALERALGTSAPDRPSLPDDMLAWARAAEAAGIPVVRILARLDGSTAIAIRLAALDLEERHGLLEPALARLASFEAEAHRKEAWIARRARLLARAGRSEEARAAWRSVEGAVATLPPARRDTAAMRALLEEARAGR